MISFYDLYVISVFIAFLVVVFLWGVFEERLKEFSFGAKVTAAFLVSIFCHSYSIEILILLLH